MNMMHEKPCVIVKRKSIQLLLDYCFDNMIEFKATPRDMPEEWEIEFTVKDIMKAVNLGMFLKENKLDLVGFEKVKTTAKTATVTTTKSRSRKTEKEEKVVSPAEVKPVGISPIFLDEPKEIESKDSSPIGNDEVLF